MRRPPAPNVWQTLTKSYCLFFLCSRGNWELTEEWGFFRHFEPEASQAAAPADLLSDLFDRYRGKVLLSFPAPFRCFDAAWPNQLTMYAPPLFCLRALDAPAEYPDLIGVEGAMRYLKDLNVELDEVTVLAVSEMLLSPTLGQLTREGFMQAWKPLKSANFLSFLSPVLRHIPFSSSTLEYNFLPL